MPRCGDAQWDESGKSSLSSDAAWASYLRWEKQLIDFYGANKLAHAASLESDDLPLSSHCASHSGA